MATLETFQSRLTAVCEELAKLAKEQGYDISVQAWTYESYQVTLTKVGHVAPAQDSVPFPDGLPYTQANSKGR